MKKLITLDGIKKGDRLLELETVQGLNGNLVGAFIYPLTVVKVTKAKVHINNDYFNCGYAFRKDNFQPDKGFYYGKKTELFVPDENDLLLGGREALECNK